jgi:type I restriction enzyme, S subunit
MARTTQNQMPLANEWEWRRLDEVCVTNTGARNPSDWPDKTFEYIDIGSIDNRTKEIKATKRILGLHAPSRARKVVHEHDVLVAMTRPNLNAVARVPADLDNAVCSTGFCVLRAKAGLDPAFLYYWTQTPTFVASLSEVVKGGLYPAVTDRQVFAEVIPVPALPVQRRIAGHLAEQHKAVYDLRRTVEAQNTEVAQLRSALLAEAFCGLTPLAVSAARDTPPSGWRWERLSALAQLRSGHTPSRRHPEWWGGSIPWIALPDIRALDGRIAMETREYTNEAGIANSSARVLPTGTVVLSRTASVGFVTIMGRPMATSQDFVNWICGPRLHGPFLMHLFRAARWKILELAEGAVHKTVYMPTVRSFEVCLPEIDEQKRIAGYLGETLEAADRLESALKSQIADIDRLPPALLREAFAGALQ